MGHLSLVREGELDGIALAHVQDRAGHIALEGPRGDNRVGADPHGDLGGSPVHAMDSRIRNRRERGVVAMILDGARIGPSDGLTRRVFYSKRRIAPTIGVDRPGVRHGPIRWSLLRGLGLAPGGRDGGTRDTRT